MGRPVDENGDENGSRFASRLPTPRIPHPESRILYPPPTRKEGDAYERMMNNVDGLLAWAGWISRKVEEQRNEQLEMRR